LFSLAALTHLSSPPVETFDTVDAGVRIATRQRAGRRRLEELQQPLEKALERALSRAERRVRDLERASASESRADDYERWGHLLMANPTASVTSDRLTLPDILGDGKDVEIPVKEGLGVIENAERFYERARSLRAERETVAARLEEARADAAELLDLYEGAAAAEDVRDIERFRKDNLKALRRFVGGKAKGTPEALPFRRFEVSGGFEVWVGRNARENDRLTFDKASPHDLWFHARGVGGSHVVLKVPGRKTVVGKAARTEAAAIAAWYSSARGSKLVPVIVTERKYVSKPKGSDPGAVRVHREDVLMVEPRIP
jgi:predicted ribosome quality control (RQC) complex YloA/Tae2 family protein